MGEGSADDLIGGKRKSKLKTLKIYLFGGTKRETKFSQSASDVTEAEGLGSAKNLCSGMLGSRALSHDSIFLADQDLSSPEQPRVLSQENVQGRIKELQMKLLQQNMHLGPPPLATTEPPGGVSYKFPAPPRHHSSLSLAGTGSEEEVQASSQPSSRPLSPLPKPPLTSSVPPTPSAPHSAISPAPPALDFSTPAQFTPCLDNSAARHRMSIKPRNQRARAKNKMLNMTESRPRSESLNNFDRPLTEKEEEEGPAITGGRTRLRCHSTLILKAQQGGSTTPTAPPELTPLKSGSREAVGCPKTSTPTLPCKPSPQEQPHPGVPVISPAPVTRQLPGAKQPQPSSVTTVQDLRYTPQQQTLKQSLGDPKPPDPSQTKRDVLSKSGVPDSTPSTEGSPKDEPVPAARPAASLASVVTLRTSSLRRKTEARAGGQSTTEPLAGQEDPGQAEPMSTGGAPKPGSRPFLFSINFAKERETSRMGNGGFLGVVEQAGAGVKRVGREEGTEAKLTSSNACQKGQEQQGGRRKGDKPKEEELTAIDMGGKVSEGEEVEEESGEGVEEAVEAKEEKEEEGKMAFGVNLRSISLRVQAEAATSQSDLKIKRHSAEVDALPLATYTPSSKPTGLEGLRDTPPARANSTPKKRYTNNWDAPTTLSSSSGRACSLREADTATPAQPTPSPLTKEAQTTPATPKEDQTIPVPPIEAQTTSSAPQDHPTAPKAAPQAAVSWMSMAWGKTRGLQQLFTSSLPREFTGMQSPTQPQAQTTTQPQTPPADEQTSPPCAQLHRPKPNQHYGSPQWVPLPLSPPAPSTLSSSPRSTPSQPPWSAQGLNPIPQPKPASDPTTTPVQPLIPALGRGERTPGLQGNSEGAAVSTEKRVDRDRPGTLGGTAAFLEKRAEWTPPAGSKVELRRTRTPSESQPTAELAAPSKATPTHRDAKDAKLDRRPESSPTIVTGRLADREDKRLRKNMPTSPSPSSSPSSSSPLQTISDSGGQPSWMELAKRKSMAWNDKTMD
ncbi:hypothetical protein J4Q44_G00195260 [Coregonus suidteri]|uniref:DUF4592 domain-containing protein n=1 Tax=Coregonus suidteri TaxID=861788 RepID=A0AAN8LF09_9TELE